LAKKRIKGKEKDMVLTKKRIEQFMIGGKEKGILLAETCHARSKMINYCIDFSL